MITLPGGWNDRDARSARPAAPSSLQKTEETPPVSVRRCLPVSGPQRLGSSRYGARTQLGMPALALPSEPAPGTAPNRTAPSSDTPPPSVVPAALAPPSVALPRRGPPPLPVRFAAPKVMVAATPLLPDTIPARRLQLSDVTCELDTADLLPVPAKRPAPRATAAVAASARHPAPQPRGVRGLVASLLVRLLSMLEPSTRVHTPPRERGRRRRS
jgi:hypothetical protein